ncbi:diguanylate cyclase [Acetobacterium tundrae]|uniref:Diguanylate cyclase n=1 Tax=Acetobacterium tundrae TaxID=132932 RepID=A0ABR6WK87_9FIRM|nr:diguanylate cyclase [Acetobacterium tundrae]MBC3796641.1 diguanylate cyclase [Acetobacterium tundrae]
MISKTVIVQTIRDLTAFVHTDEINKFFKESSSVFIQIFIPEMDADWAMSIEAVLSETFPAAVIVGGSSMGGIVHGGLCIESTILSITFLKKTMVKGFIVDGSSDDSKALGKTLQQKISSSCKNIAGVLLLATTSNMNVAEFLTGFSNPKGTFPVFGGGSGNVAETEDSLLFLNHEVQTKGVVAVAFIGNYIKIEAHTYLGWQALSKEMVVTEMDGPWVKKIDDQPAFSIYHRYLDIQNDENFFLNVSEYPLLLKRDGVEYAKTPVAANKENAIKFLSDIKVGETFRIAYGNPQTMIDQAHVIQDRIDNFNPESIFLYSCVSRLSLLQQDVDLETKPFEAIATTFGFYTQGEFYGQVDNIHLLNATMVAVSMKEGVKSRKRIKRGELPLLSENPDPFANKHFQIISRLVNFIQAVTEELEEVNKESRILAERDYLTQAYNRVKAHEFIEAEINRCQRYDTELSFLILDVDLFKSVNDTHGHNAGDAILVYLVKMLKQEIRDIDMLSRWGGEEFLIIMPETDLEGAKISAERIRKTIEQTIFPKGNHQTCSIGVTSYKVGERFEETIDRADQALYEAKKRGRNRVVAK